MAPVLAGMVPYAALIDGSVDLEDLSMMNDALQARAENDSRARLAAKKEA